MIWLIIGLIAAGSFLVTGLQVLTDPACLTADFGGGGRVVRVTCRADNLGIMSGNSAGLLSIFGGLAILAFVFRGPLLYGIRKLGSTPSASSEPQLSGHLRHQPQVNATQEGNSENESAQNKKCPQCAEIIKAEALKCKHCGSNLGPSAQVVLQKKIGGFFTKSFSGDNLPISFMISVAMIGGLVFGYNQISNAREISALKINGQICIYGDEEKTKNFGCADYPNFDASFCSISKVLNPFILGTGGADLIENHYGGRVKGNPGGGSDDGCTKPEHPNEFTYEGKVNFGIGVYEILESEYLTLTGDDWQEGGGGTKYMEISLKK